MGARARVIVGTTRRKFVYRWQMPRSPAQRILIGPLFVATALVVFVLGVLVLALMLVAAIVAIVILAAAAALLWSIRARLGFGRQLTRRR